MNASAIFNYYALISQHLWAQVLVTVAFYILITVLIEFVVNRVIKRVCATTNTTIDDTLIDFLHTPIYQTVILVGIMHIVMLVDLTPLATQITVKLARSGICLVWLITALKIINFLSTALTAWRQKLGPDLFSLVHKITFLILVFAAVATLFWIWNINLTPVFASAGVAGIAIALAAKDTLANFFGGISLFLDKVYRVGDYVIIDNNERGEVVEIGIRSTRIITRDDVLINIPNSIMATSKIVNESAPYPQYRIKVPVGVAYGTDLERTEAILLDLAGQSDTIVANPFPRVRVRTLADSSVNLELLVWVEDPRDRGIQTHLLLKQIHKRFAEEGIHIPFPQLDVHLAKEKE
ncbi:MAG: mechanosensitive ion channel family protein [Desulfobulbaceae bacterium]|nr:MAG: mechanosensitive ion channel family protein [Desulfobulbaceae bacterium]